MSRVVLSLIAAAGISLAMFPANAQVEPRSSLQSSGAQVMIAACEAYAAQRGGAVNIWVINLLGQPLGFERMDGANPWQGEWAMMKATTALDSEAPSSSRVAQFERRGVTQATSLYYQLEHFPRAGGVPILVNEKPIGAIGVEGLGPEEDERCAEAGVAALAPLVPQ